MLTDAGEFEAEATCAAGRLDLVDGSRHGVGPGADASRGAKIRAEVERQVRDGELTPALAAQQILDAAEVQ